MSRDASEPRMPPPGGLQSMLARLRGMLQVLKSPEPESSQPLELLPTWDETPPPPELLPGVQALVSKQEMAGSSMVTPSDAPAEGWSPPGIRGQGPGVRSQQETKDDGPLTPDPSPLTPSSGGGETRPQHVENAADQANESSQLEPDLGRPSGDSSAETTTGAAAASLSSCPHCQAPRPDEGTYCQTCGWIFSAHLPGSQHPAAPTGRIQDRYQLGKLIGIWGEVERFRALDYGASTEHPEAVIVLRGPALPPGVADAYPEERDGDDLVTTLDEPADKADSSTLHEQPGTDVIPLRPSWPSVAWEANLLERVQHPALPRILNRFREGDFEYLVEEVPVGRTFWDAWEDPEVRASHRFAWLKDLAHALDSLHRRGAILEALRPEIIVVTNQGQVRLTDLAELLPLPLSANAPIRATYYTAPELFLASDKADARADLYGFGALLYALHLGRELTDLDFELQGVPKPFLDRFPDAHPLFGRLVSKTFCRDLAMRFPTEEACKEDPTGFQELMRLLDLCGQQLDQVRLEIAAWSTTGIVRSGNEDAFCLISASDCRADHVTDAALILLADGMGGHEAGEVAAALALDTMKQFLLQQPALAHLTGASGGTRGTSQEYEALLMAALKEANERVYSASRAGPTIKQMGCTAEAVYVDGRQVVIGHVGDSRTYHLHEGRLIQLTRDHTWVNRMVQMGALTQQEAEEHPRRNEIQQAIGGHATVDPDFYHAELRPSDWIVICSDGLSNLHTSEGLRALLQASPSAETAARRLVNAVNLKGAQDNATVVVVRAT